MSQENPYQAPKETSWEHHDSAGGAFYPAKRCPNCNANVTFGMTLPQATPFQFKCSLCRSKYRVHTPYMPLIAVVVVVPGAALVASMPLLGIEWCGFWSLYVSIPMVIAAWVALEYATYRYVMRLGRLTPLSARKDAFSSSERASGA